MKVRDGHLLLNRIEAVRPKLTRSERQIAALMTADVRKLTLETASSVARKAKVSPMTVGRFLRTLGYGSFDELRHEVGSDDAASTWRVGDRYDKFKRHGAGGNATASFDREVEALMAAYQLASGERWDQLVKRLAGAQEIHVAGFQTVRGVAMDFAARLEYVREGVRFLDGANGTYSELFARADRNPPCLMLIDIRRYARQAQLLADAAAQSGVPVTIFTDAQCHWARTYTDDVFHVQTDVGLFWDSNAALTSLLNLLVNGVIARRGKRVGKRTEQLEGLQARFRAFLD